MIYFEKIYFKLDKIEGKGQDAEPTFLVNEENKTILLAVYDGLGSASFEYDNEGVLESSAKIASNLCKEITENHFKETDFILDCYEGLLKESFKDKIFKIEKKQTKLKGKLANKRLPTTLASIFVDVDSKKAKAIWAGDSRCFTLANNGLKQYSKDDLITNADPLDNLIDDSPMSNYVNSDSDFKININEFEFEEPAILIVSTDGCFGYLESPAHFEYVLLKELLKSFNIDEWRFNLLEYFKEITGDDISFCLVIIGFDEFVDLKQNFTSRLKFVNDNYIEPLLEFNKILSRENIGFEEIEKTKLEKNEKRILLWNEYKKDYEKYK